MRTLGSLRGCSARSKLGRILLGIGLLALAGCIAEPMDSIPGLVDGWTPQDVPVPLGFTKKRGTDWEYTLFSSGPARFRSAGADYVGYKEISEVAPWYVKQMRADGWSHETTEEGDKRILTFANSRNERAIIELDRAFNRVEDRFQTVVRIRIGPHPTEAKDVDEVLRSVSFGSPATAVGSARNAPSDIGERDRSDRSERDRSGIAEARIGDELETTRDDTAEPPTRPASWEDPDVRASEAGVPLTKMGPVKTSAPASDPLSETRESVDEAGPPLPPGYDDAPRD